MEITKEQLVKALKKINFRKCGDWFERDDNKIHINMLLSILEVIPEKKIELTQEDWENILKQCGFEPCYKDICFEELQTQLQKYNIFEKKIELNKTIIENDQEFVEDILELIKETPNIKISSENLVWLMGLDEGTLLNFEKEFEKRGIRIKNFEIIDDE